MAVLEETASTTEIMDQDLVISSDLCDLEEFPESRIEHRSDGLSREPFGAFSFDPISFEEMASSMLTDVNKLNSFAVIYNRYSESYLDISRRLEKTVSELSSCCITKAVLEKKGIRFTGLDDLRLDRLYRMISFNFRKTHAAIQGTANNNRPFWLHMLDMEFKWYNLAKRLKATAEKIELICSGKINVDSLLEKMQKDRLREKPVEKTGSGSNTTEQHSPSAAVSSPVIGSFVREELGMKPDEPLGSSRQPGQKSGAVPQPQKYASMKQRKKAERLERKHAKQQKQPFSGRTRFPASDTGAPAQLKGSSENSCKTVGDRRMQPDQPADLSAENGLFCCLKGATPPGRV